MDDAAVLAELAGARRVVALAHARERTEGVIGVLWRAGAVVAVCAHRCELAALPESIARLSALERLDVGGNRIAELSALPPHLRELYVYDNELGALPPIPGLVVLDANRNRIAELPALDGVAFVYAAANRLTSLPATRGVRYLNVSGNPLGRLELADPALVEVRAERAGLEALAFEGLGACRELWLRDNALTSIPASLAELGALEVLDLRANLLDDLPEAIAALPLRKLDLRWNPLRRRPPWLAELSRRGCLVYV